ncbi:MAG: DISARM system phospholipase D-like protein DrmC [Sandaracinaceae bacterium]
MTDTPSGLSGLSTPDLRALRDAVAQGRLVAPVTATSLAALGLAKDADGLLGLLGGLSTEGVLVALEVALAERIHRPPPHLDLVWTGPEARSSRGRDTAIVVRQLFAEARQSVVVGGFSFDHGEAIFAPLHHAMTEHGVRASLFLDIEGHAPTPAEADAYATKQIDRFFVKNWPFGQPRPDVYYDPRTAVAGPPWASLHAKCVVVDERSALITSANFTDRGQTRNIEAGVRIDDPDFARKLVGQWRGLVSEKLVRQYRG